jgi:hypothetical protein
MNHIGIPNGFLYRSPLPFRPLQELRPANRKDRYVNSLAQRALQFAPVIAAVKRRRDNACIASLSA